MRKLRSDRDWLLLAAFGKGLNERGEFTLEVASWAAVTEMEFVL